ncbi:MAG: hypothetical protein P8J32_03535 [bacterium]|nr:hypothetical protein [bacterium]
MDNQEQPEIIITGSQHNRTGELPLPKTPKDEAEFHQILKDTPTNILFDMGFGVWSTINDCVEDGMKPSKEERIISYPTEKLEEDMRIILFPTEWYESIPEDYVVTGLYGETYRFKREESSSDSRFGCLAFGIQRPL